MIGTLGGGAGPASLTLVGAGKMGGAMLQGWLAAGLPGEATTVVDPNPPREIAELAAQRGFRLLQDPRDASPGAVLVLAIKPQSLPEAAPGIAPLAPAGSLVVSILAGKTIANLRQALPEARAIVRAMPNLPASIGRGATGAFASPETDRRQVEVAGRLLACNGTVEWLADESLIDAVTALSGSGPAYVFHLVEAMAEAGTEVGLEPDLAFRLARATVVGSAALLDASGQSPAQLRESVTSKGGTTAAALEVLMGEGGLRPLMARAIAAAKRRAGELSG